jgi:hypothetical protein
VAARTGAPSRTVNATSAQARSGQAPASATTSTPASATSTDGCQGNADGQWPGDASGDELMRIRRIIAALLRKVAAPSFLHEAAT